MPRRAGPSSHATCGLCGAPNAKWPILTLVTFVPILNRKKVMLVSDAFQKTQKEQLAYRDTATWTCVPPHYYKFWELGLSLLGNDVQAKAQTKQKSRLQSPGGPRRRLFRPVVVYMNLLVRKLAGGMCWLCVCIIWINFAVFVIE